MFFFFFFFFWHGRNRPRLFTFIFACIEFIIPRIVYGFGLYRKTGVEARYFWLFTLLLTSYLFFLLTTNLFALVYFAFLVFVHRVPIGKAYSGADRIYHCTGVCWQLVFNR